MSLPALSLFGLRALLLTALLPATLCHSVSRERSYIASMFVSPEINPEQSRSPNMGEPWSPADPLLGSATSHLIGKGSTGKTGSVRSSLDSQQPRLCLSGSLDKGEKCRLELSCKRTCLYPFLQLWGIPTSRRAALCCSFKCKKEKKREKNLSPFPPPSSPSWLPL